MDIVTERHPTGIKTEEVYQSTAVCVQKAEPEVSLIYDGDLSGVTHECVCICVCVCVCVCPLLQVIYNMNFTSENARNSCMCTQNIFFILTGNSVERSIICVALYFSAFESPHHGLAL